MAPQYTLISKLAPKNGKTALYVRVTRIWEATQKQAANKQQKKLFHTGVLFIDEEASQIMLTVWNNQREDYFPLLKEGGVYFIFEFRIIAARKGFRHVDGDLALTFDHNTKVTPTEDTDRIPRFCFRLTKLEDVPPLLRATDNFIEVIGMVRDIGALEPASNGAKKMDILLLDSRQQQMLVTLWEDKAAQFQEGLAAIEGAAAFVVITGLLAKQYSATDIILSSGDGTKTYFNIDYKPLKDLREYILALPGITSDILLPPAKKLFVTTEDNTLTPATIRDILDAELLEETQVLRFLCEATIVSISDQGWYYDSCPRCPKKISMEGNKFFCDKCSSETDGYKERYMITVGVKDDTGKTTFTLFNKEVERLLGIPIERLVADIGRANLTPAIPPVLNNIIGRKCAFHAKANTYNQSGRADYTVARLSEIEAPTANIHPSPPTQQSGPSKKQKIK